SHELPLPVEYKKYLHLVLEKSLDLHQFEKSSSPV
ncbi:hypothetical protein Tco_0557615, partial [Tanacetum coccineum]